MLVYTEDVQKLITAVVRRYENGSGASLVQSNAQQFHAELIDEINRTQGSQLRASTFYKHFAIRSRTYGSPHIGYSITYLNALAQYAHEKDYLEVYDRIMVSENEVPEFPWDHPSFPATPAIRVELPGYENVWIKDESSNPTGVHKDRRTHELLLLYERIMTERLESRERVQLPRVGLISSGYAAPSWPGTW